MKAVIEGTKKQFYKVEIDVEDYSDDCSVESQTEWLMQIQNNVDALIKICEDNDYQYDSSEEALIKVTK